MSDLITNLTDNMLDDALNHASLPVLLDLWAPWCGPCLAIAPLLEKVAAATEGQLTVAKLDVELNRPGFVGEFLVRELRLP